MKKNIYEKPELEKVEFSAADVITASIGDDPFGEEDGWTGVVRP